MIERGKLTAEVDCGDGAYMTIIDPASFKEGGIRWRLRYGNSESIRLVAAQLLDSYDYLLSSDIPLSEAMRRLRLLRRERRKLWRKVEHSHD